LGTEIVVTTTELQRIPTTGARAVAPFRVSGEQWLAIPQLAADAPGTPDGINGGTSDTTVLLLKAGDRGFSPAGQLPVGGGEDVEVFSIGDRMFAAVASIRLGSGPYDFSTRSPLFEHDGSSFVPFQEFDTYAAKEFRHFRAGGHDFLGIAQNAPGGTITSTLMRWDGDAFSPFQELPSVAGYNMAAFELNGATYLAHADHAAPSRLYRFDGARFVDHQELLPSGGRAFLHLSDPTGHYLAVARIDGDSLLLRWDGDRMLPHAVIPGGAGGREFARIDTANGTYVLRVDFIHGTPADPQPDLMSHVYRFRDGSLTRVGGFRTTGGTDIAVLPGQRFAVSNGLAAVPRPGHTFAADTVIYSFDDGPGED
jgi:EPTP domain